jgi:hypothetical protein
MNWHDMFTYQEATGELVWKIRPRSHFGSARAWNIFNAKHAGNVAGYSDPQTGYKQIGVNGRHVPSHCIIWEMHYGKVPYGYEIDHADNDGSNNRISNFRLATHAQNICNRPRQSNNLCGLKGVSRRPSGKWRARIKANGVVHNLGLHITKGLAAVAYAKAALRHHGQFARI